MASPPDLLSPEQALASVERERLVAAIAAARAHLAGLEARLAVVERVAPVPRT
jgi:hypothetical protein